MQKLNMRSVCAGACLWVAVMTIVACESTTPQRSTIQRTTVTYGRITAVDRVTVNNAEMQTAGAFLGGTLGVLSGSGQSQSTRALRGVGGAFAGQQLARAMSNEQAFKYTVLVGGRSTITMVTNEGGLRVGDCVSVERGQFNNIRLAADTSCPANAASVTASRAAINEADACNAAKEELLQANDEQAFNLAERRLRLLCDD